MKFELGQESLKFLRDKQAEDLTLDLMEIPSNCWLGRLPELKISYDQPPDSVQYRHFCIKGINIHISKLLRTQETLRIFLSGFGSFKKLEVTGVNLVL